MMAGLFAAPFLSFGEFTLKSFLLHNFVFPALVLAISGTSAHAQFTYTYFPSDSTINYGVSTDFAIVGFSAGGYNEATFAREFTGPSSPTVNVEAGATIIELDSFNHSIVNVSGGDIGAILPYGHSTVNIWGGHSGFDLSDDSAVINVFSGAIDDLEGQGRRINVYGGDISTLIANDNTDFLGNAIGSCVVTVTGGNLGETDAFNAGILNLRGGQLNGVLRAAFGGTINIYGHNLDATLIDPNYGGWSSRYSLSGTLADGTVLSDYRDFFVGNDGVYYGHSSFQLHNVPGPSAAVMLVSGLYTGILRRNRKRRLATKAENYPV